MITDNDVRQCRLQTIRDVIRYAMTQFEITDTAAPIPTKKPTSWYCVR